MLLSSKIRFYGQYQDLTIKIYKSTNDSINRLVQSSTLTIIFLILTLIQEGCYTAQKFPFSKSLTSEFSWSSSSLSTMLFEHCRKIHPYILSACVSEVEAAVFLKAYIILLS